MKLILPALLFPAALSQTQAPTYGQGGETEVEEEAVDPLDLLSDTVFKEQEPVEFESIAEGSESTDYSLTGTYGGYVTAGVDYLFIQMTVSGPEIADDSKVLLWA